VRQTGGSRCAPTQDRGTEKVVVTHRLRVLISESLEVRLVEAARRSRLSKAEWVRRAIERTLSSEKMASDPLEELSRLGAPTGDIEQILAEIKAGRG